jgi:hypothetical protein
MSTYEINFRGAKLIGVVIDRRIIIPVAPICVGMRINATAQTQRIKRDPVLSKGSCMMHEPLIGPQQMVCLPLHRVNYWLAGIDSSRIKDDDIRNLVIEYQEECADALFAHFMPEYAAAIGTKLPALETRLLSEDLFDREPPRFDAPTVIEVKAVPPDHELARRTDVQDLSEQLSQMSLNLHQAIIDNSPLSRQPAPTENVRIYDKVIISCFDGCCPIAWPERVKIIDESEKHIPNVYELDHATGNKSKNGLYEMVPMSKKWNQRLEKRGSKERWSAEIQQKFKTFWTYVAYYDPDDRQLALPVAAE